MWWIWVVGIIVFLLILVFLWLLIAGADESRRKADCAEGDHNK